MLKKRYVIIAVGAVSVLLAGLLVNNAILAQSAAYDPWLDYNEDGTIDVNDLSPLGQSYGASGDPTKNVNVTNWPLDAYGNLLVDIKRPVDKYGNVKVYVTNFQPEQNVNVTNWPLDADGNLKVAVHHRYVQWAYKTVTVNSESPWTRDEDTAGYKDINLAVSAVFFSVDVHVGVQVGVDAFIWIDDVHVAMGNCSVRTYPSLGTVLRLNVTTGISPPLGAAFDIAFYMTT